MAIVHPWLRNLDARMAAMSRFASAKASDAGPRKSPKSTEAKFQSPQKRERSGLGSDNAKTRNGSAENISKI